MDTTTPEESLLDVSTHSDETLPLAQPKTEAVLDDEKFLDKPLTELTCDEFYSLMNKALGMDIKPPQKASLNMMIFNQLGFGQSGH